MTDHLSNCQDIAPHLPSPALPKVLVSQGYVQFLPCRDTLFIPQPSKWQVNLTPSAIHLHWYLLRDPASFLVLGHWHKEGYCQVFLHAHPQQPPHFYMPQLQ